MNVYKLYGSDADWQSTIFILFTPTTSSVQVLIAYF